MATIIFNTNAGSSQRYAKMLAEKTGFECVSLDKSKDISSDEQIIFIAWIMGGTVQGYADVKQKFTNIKCVCAVGVSLGEKALEDVREKNQIDSPLFLLPGAFDIKKLSGMYRMIMSMMLKMMKDKIDSSPDGEKLKSIFENGVDLVSEEKLDAVADFLLN